MKIKVDEKIYLQKYDVAFILQQLGRIPGGIIQEIFDDDYGNDDFFFMNNPAESLVFNYGFIDDNNIKWLEEQDWILDYEVYAKEPTSELETLTERLITERRTNIDEFNAKRKSYRIKHIQQIRDRFDKEEHAIHQLEALIDFRKGKVKFEFPDGYKEKESDTLEIINNTK